MEAVFGAGSVICFSHRSEDTVIYPFFNLASKSHQVISLGNAHIRFLPACWRTYQLLRRFNPNLVLTCGYERPETLGALIYARIFKKKTFLMLDNQYDDHKRSAIIECVKRIYLRFFDGFIYGGDTHRDYLRILKVPPVREVYGYNCVDNEGIEKAANTARLHASRLAPFVNYFLCVARLIKKKNLLKLVEAYGMYVQSFNTNNQQWGLVIVGEGPERKALEHRIAELELQGWIHLAGRVDRFEDVVNYHAKARAVVLASHVDEQWGLVINEAMAAGRPVLVSLQCGCASSLVDEGLNGFTFDGRSPEQLAKHFQWMHQNEHALESMGVCSLAIIRNYTPQKFAENVKMLYLKTVDVDISG